MKDSLLTMLVLIFFISILQPFIISYVLSHFCNRMEQWYIERDKKLLAQSQYLFDSNERKIEYINAQKKEIDKLNEELQDARKKIRRNCNR